MKKRTVAGAGLAMVGLIASFVLFSFWRENWAANQTHGALEQILARWLLSGSRAVEDVPNPLAPTEDNLSKGQATYEKQCAFCHGINGSGTDSGVQFYPPVPSLLSPENKLTDSQMHHVIRHGIRYTAMPAFEKTLSDEEGWAVVLWIRTLSLHPAGKPPASP